MNSVFNMQLIELWRFRVRVSRTLKPDICIHRAYEENRKYESISSSNKYEWAKIV